MLCGPRSTSVHPCIHASMLASMHSILRTPVSKRLNTRARSTTLGVRHVFEPERAQAQGASQRRSRVAAKQVGGGQARPRCRSLPLLTPGTRSACARTTASARSSQPGPQIGERKAWAWHQVGQDWACTPLSSKRVGLCSNVSSLTALPRLPFVGSPERYACRRRQEYPRITKPCHSHSHWLFQQSLSH